MSDAKRRSRWGCFWVAFALVLIAGAMAAIVAAGAFLLTRSSSATAWHHGRGVDESPELVEVWSEGRGRTKVVRIQLQGIILFGAGGGWMSSETGSADMALRSIKRATSDEKVRAIILDIDSGGGGITASDVLYEALVRFKKERPGRVVVAVFNDVAASGAYYVALAADHILAHPTTVTGSIGVLMQSYNLQELARKIGVQDVTIKSGENKDLLNPLHEISPEQRQMLQGIVDELHSRFVGLVAQSRELSEPEARKLADGRIFTAAQAMDRHLVDQVGYWRDAVRKTAELLNETDVRVFRYEEEITFASLFRSGVRPAPLSSLIEELKQTRLLYLWRP